MDQVEEFGSILQYILGGSFFIFLTLLLGKMLRPSRPYEQKLTSYESGENAVGNAWTNFNSKFYVIALIFVLFEVEIVFLFPWATVFGNEELIKTTHGLWGWFSLVEMFVFVGILSLGLLYVWKKGYLNWENSKAKILVNRKGFRVDLYEKVNQKYN